MRPKFSSASKEKLTILKEIAVAKKRSHNSPCMGQGRFPVPQRGRKREWYLMKGCMKDYSNLLDSNRERVAFIIFCLLLFFFKKLLWHGNEADFKTIILNVFFIYYINKSLHFTINTFSKHFWLTN